MKTILQVANRFVMGSFLAPLLLVCSLQPANGDQSATKLPLKEIHRLNKVFEHIKRLYVDEERGGDLINDAIEGMLAGLDPHSVYLEPRAFDNLQVAATGKFGGLGIEVVLDESGLVKVIAPIDDTPAFHAGVQAGDLITRLDDRPVKRMTLREAVNIMRGTPGTSITLTIVRDGLDVPIKVKVVRGVIQITSVRGKDLGDGFRYVRISHFQQATYNQLEKITSEMRQNEGQIKGLVLDLRNNPGGLLTEAVAVSDAFLGGGKIVSTRSRIKENSEVHFASEGELLPNTPVVVLINEGSASASEIVAGALQDHGRALIVGRKSFGKGSVQQVIGLTDGYALKLTTARYYTPNGRSIQAQGIQPDIKIPRVEVKPIRNAVEWIEEKDLSGHLENEKVSTTVKRVDATEFVGQDYELSQALTMLRVIVKDCCTQ